MDIALSAIPVGGATVKKIKGRSVVFVQPSKGKVRAFDARCTHQGCPVNVGSGGKLNCPCHGSVFAMSDGSVLNGPATTSLARIGTEVHDGGVSLT